tara:strand:+ start:30858 stop:30977 length:120 start_codon:yes stop_codon:yes gene_type:complete
MVWYNSNGGFLLFCRKKIKKTQSEDRVSGFALTTSTMNH